MTLPMTRKSKLCCYRLSMNSFALTTALVCFADAISWPCEWAAHSKKYLFPLCSVTLTVTVISAWMGEAFLWCRSQWIPTVVSPSERCSLTIPIQAFSIIANNAGVARTGNVPEPISEAKSFCPDGIGGCECLVQINHPSFHNEIP